MAVQADMNEEGSMYLTQSAENGKPSEAEASLAFLGAFVQLVLSESSHRERAQSYQLDLAEYVFGLPFGSATSEHVQLLTASRRQENRGVSKQHNSLGGGH